MGQADPVALCARSGLGSPGGTCPHPSALVSVCGGGERMTRAWLAVGTSSLGTDVYERLSDHDPQDTRLCADLWLAAGQPKSP